MSIEEVEAKLKDYSKELKLLEFHPLTLDSLIESHRRQREIVAYHTEKNFETLKERNEQLEKYFKEFLREKFQKNIQESIDILTKILEDEKEQLNG